jgi:hypothetical protein
MPKPPQIPGRFTHAEQVVELDRPKRAARRHGAKSDPLDAVRAAREVLGRDQLAQPRATGPRAALSVRLAARRSAVQAAGDAQRQLHALVIAAPDVLRERLRIRSTRQLVAACARLRVHASWDVETTTTAATLRSVARRIRELTAEPPTTARPSWCWSEPGDPTYWPGLGWARSWPPPSYAPGPILAAAAPTPPSPCSSGPPPSRPPLARPSGFDSTAPGTASSTRLCTPWP